MKTHFRKLNILVSAVLFLAMLLGLAMPLQTARANYSTFNNPNYYYATIKNAPDGTKYRQAGLSPDGTQIVAVKQVGTTPVAGWWEIVLMNADGSGETRISTGDSGTGDIYEYSNPFWSDDGTAIGFAEVHNTTSNKIIRYDISGGTRSYIYEPATGKDAANPDFLGSSKTSIVFWDVGAGGSGADLFTWDGSTLNNITNTSDYYEYEPISNADGTKIVYWSGETTIEPIDTTHTLTYSGGVWTKDIGFTPIAGTYWPYWTTPAATQIVLTTLVDYNGTLDLQLYDSTGTFVSDLTGPGYTGGTGQWNFTGSMPQGPNGEIVFTSNAGRSVPASGRDIIIAAPRLSLYVSATGSDSNPGTQAAPFATIQKGINEAVAGGTVTVAAGTYAEQLTITKPLTLTGEDGAVLDGATLPAGWTTGVKIRSGNVTFNNIDVTNYTQDGITAYDHIDMPNLHITNSKISNIQPGNWGFGIYVGYESEGFGYVPPDITTHLDFSGLLIEGNEITNVHSSALVVQSLTGTPGTLLVKNNNVHDNTTNSGIWIDCARNLLIEDNTVDGNKWGVEISCIADEATLNALEGPYGPKDITLSGNTITNNTVSGIYLYAGWPGTFTVTKNIIQGNLAGVNNTLATLLNAANNWWGDSSGPSPVGPGTGDSVSNNVNYTPWCVNQACTSDQPPLPSSFWGNIYFQTGDNEPTSSSVLTAEIGGVVYRSVTLTIPTQYAFNVPGDLAGTTVKEGGVENEIITFKIDGRIVATGVWKSGTNVHLDFHPPQAVSGGPYYGLINASISLNGSANDWGPAPTIYAWNLDSDPDYETPGQNISHSWPTVGDYTIGLQVTDPQGGVGTATTTVHIASITLGSLSQTYTGSALAATATTNPPSLTVNFAYTPDDPPVNAGSYGVTATIAGYTGSVTGTLVINPAAATIDSVGNLNPVAPRSIRRDRHHQPDGSANDRHLHWCWHRLRAIHDSTDNSGHLLSVVEITDPNYTGDPVTVTMHIQTTCAMNNLVVGWNLVSVCLAPVNTDPGHRPEQPERQIRPGVRLGWQRGQQQLVEVRPGRPGICQQHAQPERKDGLLGAHDRGRIPDGHRLSARLNVHPALHRWRRLEPGGLSLPDGNEPSLERCTISA